MKYELILLMKFIDGFHINDYTCRSRRNSMQVISK